MKTITVLISFGLFSSAWASCAYKFDDALKQCAEPYGYKELQVFRYLFGGYSVTEAPNFNSFIECVWRKWGFLGEQSDDIKYDAIRTTKIPIVTLLGYCDDVPIANSPTYQNAFPDSVDQCQREAPSDIRAETIRSCILQRFKERIARAGHESHHS